MKLSNPTGRSTECRVLRIGAVELIFSYETLIGLRIYNAPWNKVRSAIGQREYRRANEWGPTTGRHMNETSLTGADIVSRVALADLAREALKGEVQA